MTPTELATALRSPNPPHLLDVRQPDEHAFVALPNSTLIPLAHVPVGAKEIEAWKDEEIVVYCHHGVRSAMAIAYLRVAGFTKLHNLSGGLARWAEEVEPTMPRY